MCQLPDSKPVCHHTDLRQTQTLMTIATKIAQQLNRKMGGALWEVETGVRWSLLPFVAFSLFQLCSVECVKTLFTYLENVIAQFCSYCVLTPCTTFFTKFQLQNEMFIGIDCFHDIVNQRKLIAGFVSSINQELTQ